MGFWESFSNAAGSSGGGFIDSITNSLWNSKVSPALTEGNQGIDFNDAMNVQERFARSGVQWRAEDARKAGIHPLAALGGQFQSPNPIAVGSDTRGDLTSRMGQDISESVRRSMDPTQRERDELELQYKKALVAGAELENQLKQKRLDQTGAPTTPVDAFGVAAPSGMESQSNPTGAGVEYKNIEQPIKRQRGVEAGEPAAQAYLELNDGSLMPTVSKTGEERVEDVWTQIKWIINQAATEGGPALQHYLLRKNDSDPVFDKLRAIRPKHPFAPDWEYRWDPAFMVWTEHEVAKEGGSRILNVKDWGNKAPERMPPGEGWGDKVRSTWNKAKDLGNRWYRYHTTDRPSYE